MPIQIFCRSCQSHLTAPDGAAGRSFSCPKCHKPVDVPARKTEPPELGATAVPPPLIQEDESKKTKKCPFCAETIAIEAIKCRYCDSMLVPIQPTSAPSEMIQPSSPAKDPLLMGMLSGCCIAGLGQIVLGQVTKGVVFLLGAMAIGAVTMGSSILVTWPLMGIDAYMVARKLKSGRPVTEWECFPS